MQIVRLFHPILGKYIYQPKEPKVDIQDLLKELYKYQELEKRAKEKSGLNLSQLVVGLNHTELIKYGEDSN